MIEERLPGGQRRERRRRGLRVRQVGGFEGEIRRAHRDEIGGCSVSPEVRERVDGVADVDAAPIRGGLDDAGELVPGDRG